MVSRALDLGLRALEFLFTLITMSLVGNIIAMAFHHNPSIINYDMFVVTFGMLTLFYLIFVAWRGEALIHPILPVALDLLNVLFYFCAGVATAAELGAHSCSNQHYLATNKITNGSHHDRSGRCREAQAATAFFWFAWACFVASTFFSFMNSRGGTVGSIRGPRRGAPTMSQV